MRLSFNFRLFVNTLLCKRFENYKIFKYDKDTVISVKNVNVIDYYI